ncbi:MAG: uroporphyrinogen-III synthase [Dokdonella sp.]|uniref:uroporphyrinogen-III synthase n=1 Tax=Dokdonella sp. TaxID=2291710 RepID=UPI003267CE36
MPNRPFYLQPGCDSENVVGSMHATAPLAGACLIITRPVGSSASLRRKIASLGGTSLTLPGLTLRPVQHPQRAADQLRGVRSGTDWIFSSPAAVRFAFQLAPDLPISEGAGVFAVGAGTRRSLARHAVDATTPTERSDSEGVLALAAFDHMVGRNVVLIGAPGGRDLIAPTLRERGADVVAIPVYERRPARLTQRHFDALQSAPAPWITLVSSGEALANLMAQLPDTLKTRLHHQVLVVSSARLEALAHEAGFEDVLNARSAMPADLLAAAERALARHRL